jgi:hypothetical protein
VNRIVLILCLSLASAFFAPTHATPATSPHHSRTFENQYLRIRLRPGWTVMPPNEAEKKTSGDCCTVTVTHGNYTLEINPVFDHASGIIGGRMNEILRAQPSVVAVTGDDGDILDMINECIAWNNIIVTKTISLQNLYLDPAKMTKNCGLPTPPHPVWFASYDSGEGPESDYSIALIYNSTDINKLPRRDSPELRQVLTDVARMLRTVHFKDAAPSPVLASPNRTATAQRAGPPAKPNAPQPRSLPTTRWQSPRPQSDDA